MAMTEPEQAAISDLIRQQELVRIGALVPRPGDVRITITSGD
jgi:hypothetical protein